MSTATAAPNPPGLLDFLDRANTIAEPRFNRWMVPPAALCIHLCIGQAYAFSVFNLPMSKLIGIDHAAPSDWKLTDLGWIFSIAIFVLGVSAAVFGRWVEEGGPRRAMFVSGLCWAGGFFVSAVGVYLHELWIVYLGYGVLGGVGLGLGYISPVSTLIKWFPDRPGMATGMAIMGFGGGAFIASPLSVWLMQRFSTPAHIGVAETFLCLGVIYLAFMWVGAAIVRVPPPDWKPEGYTPPAGRPEARHQERRLRLRRAEDAAVLADLGGALPERHGRHRRAQPGLGDEPGDVPWPSDAGRRRGLRRPAQPVQHGRPLLLGLDLRHHRPQEHLFLLLRPRNGALRPRALDRIGGQRDVIRPLLPGDPLDVRRRLRDRSGLSQGHVRHALRRRDPRHADHRVVGGGRVRAGAGELHPAIPDRQRRAEGAGLQHDDVHHGRAAGGRLLLQSGGQGGAIRASTCSPKTTPKTRQPRSPPPAIRGERKAERSTEP